MNDLFLSFKYFSLIFTWNRRRRQLLKNCLYPTLLYWWSSHLKNERAPCVILIYVKIVTWRLISMQWHSNSNAENFDWPFPVAFFFFFQSYANFSWSSVMVRNVLLTIRAWFQLIKSHLHQLRSQLWVQSNGPTKG